MLKLYNKLRRYSQFLDVADFWVQHNHSLFKLTSFPSVRVDSNLYPNKLIKNKNAGLRQTATYTEKLNQIPPSGDFNRM